MRRSQTRLTDYNTAAALTMRTIYTLPTSCKPSSFTKDSIRLIQTADRSAFAMKQIMPDSGFLERAAMIHIAEGLLQIAQPGSRQRTAIQQRLQQMREEHEGDVVEPEATSFVSLKLLRENEGTLEGIQAVLTETAKDLGMVKDGHAIDSLIVAGYLLSVRNTLAVQDAGKPEEEDTVHRWDYVWPISRSAVRGIYFRAGPRRARTVAWTG
ncbi:hypothetical protein CF326_g5194 [Tilletia indica]|nr:hypothetical protein CF326_g5194 [Tilletia indica]